jgi:pyridoxamine 5'-phosphate oxidase
MSSAAAEGVVDISTLRKEYSKKGLDERVMGEDPIGVFKEWFDEACVTEVLEPNAFCLATCIDNRPSARIVLMKGFDDKGIVWYTNYESRKSQEMTDNPYAAATFWWGPLERSIRIEGQVEKVRLTMRHAVLLC